MFLLRLFNVRTSKLDRRACYKCSEMHQMSGSLFNIVRKRIRQRCILEKQLNLAELDSEYTDNYFSSVLFLAK